MYRCQPVCVYRELDLWLGFGKAGAGKKNCFTYVLAGSRRNAGTQTHSHIVSRSIADAQDVTTCICILYYHKAIKLSCKSTVLFCNCVTRFFKGLEWDDNDG